MQKIKTFGAGILLLSAVSCAASLPEKKPNVLLIIVDDLRNDLNCYGVDYIKSPHIDKLAENGFLFTRAYVQQAVCSASRASLLTGCRPNTTGVDYPYSQYFINEFWPAHPSIPEYFEEQGYSAYTFGKVHHGGGAEDKLKTRHYNPGGVKYYALEENIRLGGERGRSVQTPPYESADVSDEAYQDGMIAQEAVNTIKKVSGKGQPFFLAVGFKKPHLPFCAPKKYWDMYMEDEIGLAPYRLHPENSPEYSTVNYELQGYKEPDNISGGSYPEHHQLKLRHGYAACVSYIDAQVGKLMKQLEESGELDNTIVMLISDHGWHLGDQGMWGKATNFENSTLSPLILSVPGTSKGLRLSQLVEYVDIYPTLVELAGFVPANYLEGNSFVPLLNNPQREWKTAAFSQYPRGRIFEGYTLRTENFRYVEWRMNKNDSLMSVELYDHRIDPLETKNFAFDKTYHTIVNEHARLMKKGWKEALPDGVHNKSNNPLAPPAVPWGPEAERESVRITTGEFIPSEISKDTRKIKNDLDLRGLSKPDVTRETAFLFGNLKKIGKEGIIFGHHHASIVGQNWKNTDGSADFTTDSHISVGDHPGVFGFDFGRGTTIFKEQTEEIFRRGGIVTFSWHCPNPVTGENYRDMSGSPVTSILEGGKYLDIWKKELDKIADFFNNLSVDGIKVPAIFRPFHENTGSWFWWGRVNATSEEFIQLWRITADYLRIEKGVDNILLAYSPSYSQFVEKDLIFETYPGDDYVDIIGIDSYNQDEQLKTLIQEGARVICQWTSENHKIPALTEVGIRKGIQNSQSDDWFMDGFLNTFKNDDVAKNVAYVLTWMNGSPENYWIPLPGQPNHESFVNFYKDPTTFFLSDLKNIYGL